MGFHVSLGERTIIDVSDVKSCESSTLSCAGPGAHDYTPGSGMTKSDWKSPETNAKVRVGLPGPAEGNRI